jgi:molecular chaperone IbpA
MTTFDFSPLFRSTIGFDRMTRLLEASARLADGDSGYPPYNIEAVGDDHYRLTVAVAGFADDDLDVEMKENTLTIAGTKPEADEKAKFLYRGIAGRAFKRQFRLADYVEAENANLENGLLTIDLVRRVPEAMKPRRIDISRGAQKQLAA